MAPNKLKALCPACGAELKFQSSLSVFAVCEFCRSMVVRHDLKLETLGKMAELPAEVTPLQVGARGVFQGEPFTLIGRLRIHWERGQWSEWCMLFDRSGATGWLADAQGFLMVMLPVELSEEMKKSLDFKKLQAGHDVAIGGRRYKVEDIKEAVCAGSEGELPFLAPQGRKSLSVDLVGEGGLCATLDRSSDGIHAYAGRGVEFDELKLTGLRELDGW